MFDHLALFADLGERIDADGEMDVGPVAVYAGIAVACFYAFGRERLVGHEQQCAAGDLVLVTDDEYGGRFHVDADGRVFLELLAEFEVVLPDAAVRGVNDAGSVIETAIDELLRDKLVQLE